MIADPIEFYCKGDFATLVLPRGSKIPNRKWKDDITKGRDARAFDGFNIAVRCGVPCCDGYLVVIDVDPRNGGLESLKALPHEMPMTLTVDTGGGGLHFYFVSDEPVSKGQLAPGIDVQGVGSYVVGAGSIHENGKPYVIRADSVDYVERLPDWLPLKGVETETFNPTSHADQPATMGSRNNHLTSEAGRLLNAGYSGDALRALVLAYNEAVVKPPLGKAEVLRILKSAESWEAPTVKKVVAPTSRKVEPQKHLTDWGRVYDAAPNIVKQIAGAMLDQAPRQYPQFALGAALAVIAGSVQGAYTAPSLTKPGESAGMLNLFVWAVAPASAGKDFYLRAVDETLRAVDARLVGGKVGSLYGLRGDLFAFNSRTLVMDEMQDELARLGAKNSSYLSQVMTELKELYNPRLEMPAINIKDRTYPAIKGPKLSVYGTGTLSGFKKHLTGETIGGGLLSRFVVLAAEEIPDFRDTFTFRIDPAVLDPLVDAFDLSLTSFGKEQMVAHEISTYQKIGQVVPGKGPPPTIEHEAQTAAVNVLGIDDEARGLLAAFRRRQQATYQKLIAEGGADNDLGEGSLIDRSGQLAVKIASLAAFGGKDVWATGVPTITATEARFAILFVEAATTWLANVVKEDAGNGSDNARLQGAIMDVLRKAKEPLLASSVMTALRHTRPQARFLNPALYDLCMQGRVVALVKGSTTDAVSFDDGVPKGGLYGARFFVPD